MPLIQGFLATNVWNAFILNSLASALVIIVAMLVKDRLDTYKDKSGEFIERRTSVRAVVFTFVVTFFTSLFALGMMHVVFGYGKGMTINSDS